MLRRKASTPQRHGQCSTARLEAGQRLPPCCRFSRPLLAAFFLSPLMMLSARPCELQGHLFLLFSTGALGLRKYILHASDCCADDFGTLHCVFAECVLQPWLSQILCKLGNNVTSSPVGQIELVHSSAADEAANETARAGADEEAEEGNDAAEDTKAEAGGLLRLPAVSQLSCSVATYRCAQLLRSCRLDVQNLSSSGRDLACFDIDVIHNFNSVVVRNSELSLHPLSLGLLLENAAQPGRVGGDVWR